MLWKLGNEPISDYYLQSAVQAAISEFDKKCAYCWEEKEPILDYAVPIDKTDLGQHHIGNLIPSCRDCNGPSRKGRPDFRLCLRGQPDGEKKTKKGDLHIEKAVIIEVTAPRI